MQTEALHALSVSGKRQIGRKVTQHKARRFHI